MSGQIGIDQRDGGSGSVAASEFVRIRRPRRHAATLQRVRWPKTARYAAGALLAPLIAPVLHAVLSAYGALPGHEDEKFSISIPLVLMSYAGAIPLGAILVAVLAARERLAAPYVIAWATLAGLACGTLFGVAMQSPLSGVVLVFGLIGAIWALFTSAPFCAVAGVPLRPSSRERPVRSDR